MAKYFDDHFPDSNVKKLEKTRRAMAENIGARMYPGDWDGEIGHNFRRDSLKFFVRKYLQATMNRQFGIAANQVAGMIRQADEKSGITGFEKIQMVREEPEVVTQTVEKVPAIFMEQARARAREKRDKAKRIIRGSGL